MSNYRLSQLAGRHNVAKNWDSESSSSEEEEEEAEGVAETGSKGSMNQAARPASSRVQSDAETQHSTRPRRPQLHSEQDSKAARHLLDGRKR